MAGKQNGRICSNGKACPSSECRYFEPGLPKPQCILCWPSDYDAPPKIRAAVAGVSVRQVERDEESALSKLRTLARDSAFVAQYPLFFEQYMPDLTTDSPERNVGANVPDVGSDPAIVQGVSCAADAASKDHPMKHPTLICEIAALHTRKAITEADITKLHMLAAAGDPARCRAEIERLEASAENHTAATEPDAFEVHSRNPHLGLMMRVAGLTAANIREHGPRGLLGDRAEPNLRELIDNTTARGDRMGTGR